MDISDVIAKEFYGITISDAKKLEICVKCKNKMGSFNDEFAERDYRATGFCLECQEEEYEEKI